MGSKAVSPLGAFLLIMCALLFVVDGVTAMAIWAHILIALCGLWYVGLVVLES